MTLADYRFTQTDARRYTVTGPRGFSGLLVRNAVQRDLLFLVIPVQPGHTGRGVTTQRIAGFQWFTDKRGTVEGYS